MVRARLLQHLVKDASIRRASRLLSIHGGDKVVIGIFPVELPHFLLLFVFLEASTGGPIFVDGLLAFPSFRAEEGADCLLPCRLVGYYVHQLVDGLRSIAT